MTKTSLPRTFTSGRALCSPSSNSLSSCALNEVFRWAQTFSPKSRLAFKAKMATCPSVIKNNSISCKFFDPDRHEPAISGWRRPLKYAAASGAAGSAAAVRCESPFRDVEPLSSDQHGAALMAVGAARAWCEDVADVRVADAIA